MRIARRTVVTSALVLVACAPQPETAEQMQARMSAESDSARTYIAEASRMFAAHMVAGRVDSVVAFYAAEATVMPPNMPPARGTAAIKAAFDGMMAQGAPKTAELRPVTVVANGPLAIETGRFVMTMAGPGGAVMADSGKYMVHWHKINGKWMIVDDMWSSDLPPMPMPAPSRRGS